MTKNILPPLDPATGEEWKFIPAFAEGYAISNLGRIISYRQGGPKYLSPSVNHLRGNYLSVGLSHPETHEHTRHRVHVLVLATFVGPRPDGFDIRHLDGDPSNNHVLNLAYGTKSENMQDALLHGTHNNASKTHCKRGHELGGSNVHVDPRGRRFCLACRASREFASREKNAEAARRRRAADRENYNRQARERRHAKKASMTLP